jgi:hypothetical protein
VPVKVATPAPSRLIQASRVNVDAPRCGAGPNVIDPFEPPSLMAELAGFGDTVTPIVSSDASWPSETCSLRT